MPAATTLSRIVEMTSLTPRVTLSTAATPAQAAPIVTATSRTSGICSAIGRSTAAPTEAASSAASAYWPSTPMLNSAMRKPIATATPARYSGTALLTVMMTDRSSVPSDSIVR